MKDCFCFVRKKLNFSHHKMLRSWSVYANADEGRHAIWFQNKEGKGVNWEGGVQIFRAHDILPSGWSLKWISSKSLCRSDLLLT